jgi:hypothetical protein
VGALGVGPLVGYSVHFIPVLESIPEVVRHEMRQTMQQVAAAVDSIPAANAFWSSIHSSLLQIDVAGFRLLYRILPRSGEIHVVEVTRIQSRRT